MSHRMQNRILFYNSISPLVFQIITIICGFILPKLILTSFGSEVNGLVNSISQFLGVIAFLELGIGAVVKSSLYKPLANEDYTSISEIICSADKFFRKLGYLLLVYVIVMVIVYPAIVNQRFSFWFTASLILAISVRSFAQYFFGIVNRLLLVADQKAYIQYNAQSLAVLLNTLACFLLIKMHCSVQSVYGMTSLIFFIQPLLIHLYVRKKYKINRRISYIGEPIKQKWNGIAQHISALVLDSSDIIIITIFSTLGDVSIYSIYMLVIKGIKQLCLSMINGIQALIGRIWAQKDLDTLKQIFCWAEWTIHTFTVLIFSLTAVLIIPFIEIFTFSISDADYIQPKFAVLLVIANSLYCLSLPYLMMILAASHYKQTQNKFIFSAAVNVLVSIFCLREFGLVGIAMGTFVAMVYQVVWMWEYTYNNLINLSLKDCIKQVMVDIIGFSMIYFVCNFFCSETANYFEWTLIAIKTTIIGIAISATINYIFYKQFIVVVFKKIYKY